MADINAYSTELENLSENCEQNADVGQIEDIQINSVEKSVMQVLPGSNMSTVPMLIAVKDFDRKNRDNPFEVAEYANDIYKYLKNREKDFPIKDYMANHAILTTRLRSLLVEYMEQTRKVYLLQHATLYLGVKIMDLCLSRMKVKREKLNLLAFTALFIASKYNESKPPPPIYDLLCLSDYTVTEALCMEKQMLLAINYSLGIPLSYNFLERFARCAKVSPKTFALARYILEMSLMNYECATFSDSKLAAAALFLALRMCENKTWSSILIYYTDYRLSDFVKLVPVLNETLYLRNYGSYDTICNKYSNSLYYKVAKLPLLSNTELLKNNEEHEDADMNKKDTHEVGGSSCITQSPDEAVVHGAAVEV